MALDPKLRALLVCPQCKGKLADKSSEKGDGLECSACKLLFHVKDDIPVMLVDEATRL